MRAGDEFDDLFQDCIVPFFLGYNQFESFLLCLEFKGRKLLGIEVDALFFNKQSFLIGGNLAIDYKEVVGIEVSENLCGLLKNRRAYCYESASSLQCPEVAFVLLFIIGEHLEYGRKAFSGGPLC
ncbi:hypothetical protein SDC9_196756 [bioreactor metagenome]|uniref:Uncharacterized protein n=1 Tax=bioreactor metagenome TaxID=1076179 RepID=A0A645IPH1_9ZZZZ